MNGQSPALQAWSERGLRKVVLPTGTQVKVRLPAMESLLRRGIVPPELRTIALRFATSGIDLEKLSEEDLVQFLEFKQAIVAEAIKYVADRSVQEEGTPEWEPVTLRPADLEEFDLDDADLTAINAVVMRQATPERVSADALANLGLTDKAQEAHDADTPGGAVPDYATFRGGAGGPADSAPGGQVGDAAERAPRGKRSRGGVRG